MLARIEISDELIQAAMQATGLGSEAEAVEGWVKAVVAPTRLYPVAGIRRKIAMGR